MLPDEGLIAAIRTELQRVADPDKAPAMQAYMRSAMPFLGVPKPERSQVTTRVFAAHPLADRPTYEATVRALWNGAAYREERYSAIALTGYRLYRQYQDVAALRLYDEMVVTGAWWDYVDEIASRRIGPVLRADPGRVTPIVRSWAHDPDRWRRRVSIIAQLGAKQFTDLELLTEAIEANLAERDFFIRKAIGWALREYAKTDPEWVREFVAARAERMAPLSRREALRTLGG
jgi:3-methyladenine DNA glycosylase AlkD